MNSGRGRQELTFTSWDGTPLHMVEWHRATAERVVGPPLLVVHGLGEHAGRYQSFVDTVWERLHQERDGGPRLIYSVDLRGHGRSPGRRGAAPGVHYWVEDIAAICEWIGQRHADIEGVGSEGTPADRPEVNGVRVIAHSMGGYLVLRTALQYPALIQDLFLIGPYLQPAFKPAAWRLAAARWLDQWWPDLTMNVGLQFDQLARDRDVQLAIQQDPLSHQRMSVRVAMEMLRGGEQLTLSAQRLQVPCTLVHGGEDRVNSLQATAEFARQQLKLSGQPRLDFVELEGGYHQIHNDSATRPIVVDRLVEWFFGR